MHETLFKAFPDMKVNIIDMAAEGDTVWTMKDFYGTHTGSWLDIPPTGKKVKFRVIDVIKMRDGKFINHRQASDFVQLLEHLRVAAKAELKWFEHK
ncbi:hypothetical protein fh0823_25280 [Francisella halioticida]|nr:ester cyclase [Francisella halioticida]BCD92389.1 hypothetical protein fh0823_25280 [Francisella halioticida]